MAMICLSDAQRNKNYKIDKLKISDKSLNVQMQNLGFVSGENIKLLFYNYGKKSLMVEVMGVKYAVDKVVANDIMIYE